MANGISEVDRHTLSVTIADGASLSPEIDLGLYQLVAIIPPASIAGTVMTFQAGIETGAVGNLANASGEVSYPLANSQRVAVNLADFVPWQFLKLRTGTAATPSVQTGAKTFTLIVKLI